MPDGTFTKTSHGADLPHPVPASQADELTELLGLRDTVRALLDAEAASETPSLSTPGSVAPPPPGATPQGASERAADTTQPQAPLRGPGGETPPTGGEAPRTPMPPAPQSGAPPARPNEAPTGEAMK